MLAVGRCELRTHEQRGHHGLGGFTPAAGAAACAGLRFRTAGLPAGCGGGLLLQPVVHDHHEQRPPQTGARLNSVVSVLMIKQELFLFMFVFVAGLCSSGFYSTETETNSCNVSQDEVQT